METASDTSLTTAVPDVRNVPLGQLAAAGSSTDRITSGAAKRAAVAAFQSSI